jgi:polysaccharide deacetylase 2 family uncharacterized protein YibQ
VKLPGRLGGKPKTKKTRRTRKKTKGLQVTPLTWILLVSIVGLVGGIGLLKWAETGTGQATLLSLGSEQAFQDVQSGVESLLVQQFSHMQPGPVAIVQGGYDWPAPDLGAAAFVRCRLVPVEEDIPYDKIQMDLERSLRKIGARVLWGQRLYPDKPGSDQQHPNDKKDLLRLDIGVKGKPTHTLVFHRSGKTPPVIWGNQDGPSAWDRLLEQSAAPVVALIIDDWGNARTEATAGLLKVPAPMTMAILPNLPYSRKFYLEATDLILPEGRAGGAENQLSKGRSLRLDAGCFVEVRQGRKSTSTPLRRREVILHQPMEPQSYPDTNPGASPLLVGMTGQEISAILDGALKNLPGVRGLNNHMGSAATSDQATMKTLMEILRQRDLFFIDSLTSSRSAGYSEALAAGVPSLRNRIFLDYDSENEKTIAANLEVVVRTARKKGFAVGIGHPHRATWRVLEREIPRLMQQGVRFVTVSEMMALQEALAPEELP